MDAELVEQLRSNVAEYLTGGPYDLLLGSETTTTTVETEICTASFPQRCHTTEIEIPGDGWEWNGDNPFGSIDWTGIHTGPKNGVLIAPDILISATHMGSMQIFGRPITFYGPDGQSYDRDAIAYIDVPGSGDVRVNLLNEPLPPEITPVKLPDPDFDLRDLKYALTLTLTWEDTVHVGWGGHTYFGGIGGQDYIIVRSDADYRELYEKGSGGDSGTGLFFVHDDELVVVATLHHGPTPAGPYLGTQEIQDSITVAMDQLGSEFEFETVEWNQANNVDAVLASFEIDDTREKIGGRRMRVRR